MLHNQARTVLCARVLVRVNVEGICVLITSLAIKNSNALRKISGQFIFYSRDSIIIFMEAFLIFAVLNR